MLDTEFDGHEIRSRVKWLEEGEAPTAFFLKLENQKHKKHFTSSLWNLDGRKVFSLPDLMAAHEEFYSSLFMEEQIDVVVQNSLLSCVFRSLSQNDRQLYEGLFSLEELTQALQLVNRNKTPGPDGLTVEFYLAFWDSLGPLLVEVLSESYWAGELRDSMNSSVTCLVHDKWNLKNWRPISLLNTDYKIGSKALSLRLSKVLSSIIDPDQTCCQFRIGLFFSNLALLRDTLSYIEHSGEKGILISLDQEKAIYRTNRYFFMELLSCFGFSPSFWSWISTLYNGAYMCILANDFPTNPVYLQRGVRRAMPCFPRCIYCVLKS